MKIHRTFSISVLLLIVLLFSGCLPGTPEPTQEPTQPPTEAPTQAPTRIPVTPVSRELFDFSRTGFGFFPTPPEPTASSSVDNIKRMSGHADVLLFQEQVPWLDFQEGVDSESPRVTVVGDLVDYVEFYGMRTIMVVDPLNGLNRREFQGVPAEWGEVNFSTPEIRTAYQSFAVRLARDYQPAYLGLASEINTYLDAYPEDAEHFISLYKETYAAVKEVSPDTQVFVTFQWDDLNRLDGDGTAYDIKWEQIEAFEPELDIWAVSSYPYFFFDTPADIPGDYYSPLLARTDKPLAIAESGWTSRDLSEITGSPEKQAEFLRKVDAQIGDRLAFWINLLYADLNWEDYRIVFAEQGTVEDMTTLSNFIHLGLTTADGEPKPALTVWDELRTDGE